MYIKNDWDDVLKDEWHKDYFLSLCSRLKQEFANSEIYPSRQNVFRALVLTTFADTKVVIIGQDPYHGGQANGLCFSVKQDCPLPPSLQNIFKEIDLEYKNNHYTPKTLSTNIFSIRQNGDLSDWAKQGVLLLNTVLTVKKGLPNSHKDYGWERFTDAIIQKLNESSIPKIFLLWGNFAKQKQQIITNPIHYVLTAAHPSPLARTGFIGCNHFIKANEILSSQNLPIIKWI